MSKHAAGAKALTPPSVRTCGRNRVWTGQEHPCLVKDFSDGGVRLQPNGFEIPMTSRCCLHPTSQPEAVVTRWFGAWEGTWALNSLAPRPSPMDTMPAVTQRCLLMRSNTCLLPLWRTGANNAS